MALAAPLGHRPLRMGTGGRTRATGIADAALAATAWRTSWAEVAWDVTGSGAEDPIGMHLARCVLADLCYAAEGGEWLHARLGWAAGATLTAGAFGRRIEDLALGTWIA